jgi:hypothetical protein
MEIWPYPILEGVTVPNYLIQRNGPPLQRD